MMAPFEDHVDAAMAAAIEDVQRAAKRHGMDEEERVRLLQTVLAWRLEAMRPPEIEIIPAAWTPPGVAAPSPGEAPVPPGDPAAPLSSRTPAGIARYVLEDGSVHDVRLGQDGRVDVVVTGRTYRHTAALKEAGLEFKEKPTARWVGRVGTDGITILSALSNEGVRATFKEDPA